MERMEMTASSAREEFENLDYFAPTGEFNGIIIIPTNEMHESGYMCMKFALMDHWEVVGCVGGSSDVIHLNGIGGYGKYENFKEALKTGLAKRVDWSIDCLPNGLIRLFCSKKLELDEIICSDFNLYVKEE